MSKDFNKFKKRLIEFDQEGELIETHEYMIQLAIMCDEFLSSPEYDTLIERMKELNEDRQKEMIHLHHYLQSVKEASDYLLENIEWLQRLKEMRE